MNNPKRATQRCEVTRRLEERVATRKEVVGSSSRTRRRRREKGVKVNMTDYVGWRRRRRGGAVGNARSIVCRRRDKSLTTVAERLGAQPSGTARPARVHVPEAIATNTRRITL